jgi:hypothetical protein
MCSSMHYNIQTYSLKNHCLEGMLNYCVTGELKFPCTTTEKIICSGSRLPSDVVFEPLQVCRY